MVLGIDIKEIQQRQADRHSCTTSYPFILLGCACLEAELFAAGRVPLGRYLSARRAIKAPQANRKKILVLQHTFPLGLLVCGAYKHIHTMEEKRMQKTNKKYRTKKLLLLVFPFSFLSVLVLVLLLLLLFSHLLPISLSLSLSLTYLSASHKAATKASEIATNHGAVLLGRRPPAQPARAQQTLLVMAPRRSIPMEANTTEGTIKLPSISNGQLASPASFTRSAFSQQLQRFIRNQKDHGKQRISPFTSNK